MNGYLYLANLTIDIQEASSQNVSGLFVTIFLKYGDCIEMMSPIRNDFRIPLRKKEKLAVNDICVTSHKCSLLFIILQSSNTEKRARNKTI